MMEGSSSKGRRSSRKLPVEDTSEDKRSTRSKTQEGKDSQKRKTRGSLSKTVDKAEPYLVKGKPKIIRKTKEAEKEAASRKRTHSQLDDEKIINHAKRSKVSVTVERITTIKDATKTKDEKMEEEEEENDEEEEETVPKSKKIEKIDPYSPDFSVKDFATWLKDGKKGKGWKKAEESPKSGQKKSSGKGWVKITNSNTKKEDKGLSCLD